MIEWQKYGTSMWHFGEISNQYATSDSLSTELDNPFTTVYNDVSSSS